MKISEKMKEYDMRNADYHFTGSSIPEIWENGNLNIKETIKSALNFFEDFHATVDEAQNCELVAILAENSLLGEAYVNAVLAWNHGDYQMVPSSLCFYCHLKLLMERLKRDGFEISEEWLESIF